MADRECQSLSLCTESKAILKSINATKSFPRFLDRDLYINVCNTNALSVVLYPSRNPACDSSTQLVYIGKLCQLPVNDAGKYFP